MSLRRRAGATTAVALAALLTACASCGPPGGAGPDEDRGRTIGRRGGSPSEMGTAPRGPNSADAARQMLAEQSAVHLASVRTRLNLSPQQGPAWNAYEDSVRALLADLAREAPESAPASAVQRIDRRVDVARNRYAALEGVADAMRALYGQLNDEQRQVADRTLVGTVPSLSGGAFGPAPEGDTSERPARSSGGRSQRTDRRPT